MYISLPIFDQFASPKKNLFAGCDTVFQDSNYLTNPRGKRQDVDFWYNHLKPQILIDKITFYSKTQPNNSLNQLTFISGNCAVSVWKSMFCKLLLYNLFVYQSLSLISCLSVSIKIYSVPAVGGEKYLELNCGQLQKLMTEGTFEICNVAKQSILLCALWLQSPGLGGHVREINQHFHLYFLEVL